ncbi:MAG TPA: HAD-IA family hydrolase [Candidatus Polarisedimenticolaceae bacterium]|nr:HAD-IA family hydrolase [Candidatus Polarisedimenticolaceae bacterium]
MRGLRHPWVLFDAGGTLLGPRESYGAVYARLLAEEGVVVPADVVDRALHAHWAHVDRTLPEGADRYGIHPGGEREYWLRFVEGTLARVPGVLDGPVLATRMVDRLREAFLDPGAWSVYDDVVPALRALTGMGARLGIVSNWDSRLPLLLERLGLAGWFDAVAVSHEVGYEKPRPEPFLRALTTLGGSPGLALHVGDSPELDEAGASAAGIACVLVDRDGADGIAGRFVPDLSSVPAIVRGGAA